MNTLELSPNSLGSIENHMALRKNSNIERKYFWRTTIRSWIITWWIVKKKDSSWLLINLLIWHLKNLRREWDSRRDLLLRLHNNSNNSLKQVKLRQMTHLIGEKREQWQLLKIKDHVVHAGLFQLQELLRDTFLLIIKLKSAYLNNN